MHQSIDDLNELIKVRNTRIISSTSCLMLHFGCWPKQKSNRRFNFCVCVSLVIEVKEILAVARQLQSINSKFMLITCLHCAQICHMRSIQMHSEITSKKFAIAINAKVISRKFLSLSQYYILCFHFTPSFARTLFSHVNMYLHRC